MAKEEKVSAEEVVQDIRRQTRKKYNAEEKIRIVLEGLRGEERIAELCRREGIAPNMYYKWSKEFLEAGKARLTGDGCTSGNCVGRASAAHGADAAVACSGGAIALLRPRRAVRLLLLPAVAGNLCHRRFHEPNCRPV